MVNPETYLITPEYVRLALDHLIQVTAEEHVNPLQFLQLVEARMLTADYTFFPKPRQFALDDLLISVIQDQYNLQRNLHSLPSVKSGDNLASAIATVKEDAVITNPDLIGWTWFYFHYVEANLHITQQKFCEMVNLDDRTIRRYQTITIDQLTKYLIRMEQQARESRRKNLLNLQLPHQGNVSGLLEREQSLDQLRGSGSKHFHIVGAPGIGKTVFTEMVLQEFILSDQLDQIIWLQSPENTEGVKAYLKERLLIKNTSVTIDEYVLIKQIAIVIDDSEALHANPIALENFLQEFSNAYIFLTSHVFYPLPNCFQLNLSELSIAASKLLLSSSNSDYEEFVEGPDFNRLIWQSIGGNPLAIKLLAQNWSIFDVQSAALMTLDDLFSSIYSSLKPSENLAWLILAVLNSSSITLADLSQLDSSDISVGDFVVLSRLRIATTAGFDNPHISLTLSAFHYIQHRYESNLELQSSFDVFMRGVNWKNDISLDLIESVLTTGWMHIHPAYLLEATQKFWETGLLRGHYSKWHSILGNYSSELTPDNVDLVLGYGICLRYLGQWSEAYSTFVSVVQYMGRYGYFLRQAEALLELAILLRYQGDYQGVGEALDHVDRIRTSKLDMDIQRRLSIERIELALETNNTADAKSFLNDLPDNEPRKNILQIEIYAKTPASHLDVNSVVSLSDKLFFSFGYSDAIIARVHILMGRIWEKNSDTQSAAKHLSIALSLLLEQDNDPFALGRTQSNLAGVFISSNRLIEARELLSSAKYIQRQIGDRVGLAVTMHNEHVVDRKIVN